MSRSMILDLYACAGGWDEGARLAGLGSTIGIEIEHDPCRTAVAAGHSRIRADIATYPTGPFVGKVAGLIASPPCQAWSNAGKRRGELDRGRVHQLVDRYTAGDPSAEWAWSEAGWADPDSHHAAQPVRWIRDLRPAWVALEQVPPVLPLWEHIARVIRPWGYTTWCGILNAADYGVPQTRQRAFLLASRTGVAQPPEPTHAKDPVDGLFGRRERWVSMANALGWDGVDRPARTVCGDRSPRWAYGEGKSYGTGWTLVGNQKPDDGTGQYQSRPADGPAQSVTTQADRYRWELCTSHRHKVNDRTQPRGLDEPALTVNFGHSDMRWVRDRPATTVQGDPRIGRPGHKDRAGGESQFEQDSVRITRVEAAILQSFRPDYPWHGTKTSVFSQIGNAVPPVLAAAVLGSVAGAHLSARAA